METGAVKEKKKAKLCDYGHAVATHELDGAGHCTVRG